MVGIARNVWLLQQPWRQFPHLFNETQATKILTTASDLVNPVTLAGWPAQPATALLRFNSAQVLTPMFPCKCHSIVCRVELFRNLHRGHTVIASVAHRERACIRPLEWSHNSH